MSRCNIQETLGGAILSRLFVEPFLHRLVDAVLSRAGFLQRRWSCPVLSSGFLATASGAVACGTSA